MTEIVQHDQNRCARCGDPIIHPNERVVVRFHSYSLPIKQGAEIIRFICEQCMVELGLLEIGSAEWMERGAPVVKSRRSYALAGEPTPPLPPEEKKDRTPPVQLPPGDGKPERPEKVEPEAPKKFKKHG